ncbi:MAG: O-antigen ligase family protein [Dehalococcoidales bacterium]
MIPNVFSLSCDIIGQANSSGYRLFLKVNKVAGMLSDAILAAQPLFAIGIYLTFLIGNPPLWISWCIALIPWVLRFWHTKKLTERTPFDIPILIFTIGIIIGFFVSPNKDISWQGLHTYIASILVYYGIINNRNAKANYWLAIGGVICFIFIGLTIFTFSQGDNRLYFFNEWIYNLPKIFPKIDDLLPSYNTTGAFLGTAIPFLLALVLFQKHSRLRVWAITIFILFSILLFLIGSGGGWLSAIIGTIFILSCWKIWTLFITLPAFGVSSWVVITSLNKASTLASTWVATMFPLSDVESRIRFWRETGNLLKDHLFSGLGIGSWHDLYAAQVGHALVNPHNTYLQLYSDTGLLGGLAVIIAAVVFIYICWNTLHSSIKRDWDGIAIGVIGVIIAGMINAVFEVNISVPLFKGATITGYIASPFLWVWAAFLVVAYYRLHPEYYKIPIKAG